MDRTVLLVDDDAHLIRTLARTLHRQPYRLYTARDAEEAAHVLRTQAIDLVVCDHCLPGTHGAELLAWVAENLPHVVRIMLTGHAALETATTAINRGKVFRFLTKPCRDLDLAMAIRDGLDECRRLPATTGV